MNYTWFDHTHTGDVPAPAEPVPPVGFLGAGAMGLPMLLNLRKTRPDIPVYVFGRSPERLARALNSGAVAATSIDHLMGTSRVVISMLPDLPELYDVLDNVKLSELRVPTVLVVASSVNADSLKEFAAWSDIESRGLLRVVDAPVSGGTVGAEAGTLAIMLGGAKIDVDIVMPILRTMGKPVYFGPLGAGQVAKACNQMIVAATMTALSEAAIIAERSGLDVDEMFECLGGGYAGSRLMQDKRPRLINQDYRPGGMAKYMTKDLESARAVAASTGTVAPQLDILFDLFSGLVTKGLGDSDLAVVHQYLQDVRV
jgi:2-hydroxy-3-oxopropionate reductase